MLLSPLYGPRVYRPYVDAYPLVRPLYNPYPIIPPLIPPFVPAGINGSIYPGSVYLGIDRSVVNLNSDPSIINKLTKQYRYMILDKWIYDDLGKLLGYFKVSGDKVDLINDVNEYKPDSYTKDSEDVIEKKIKFIEDVFLTEHAAKKLFKKFIQDTEVQWINFPHSEHSLKKYVKKYLKQALLGAISSKKK